jgi:hypothetical protein
VFDRAFPPPRPGHPDGHIATLTRWRELDGDVGALVRDPVYLETLYRTLGEWGIGRRGSRLVPFDRFRLRLRAVAPRLAAYQSVYLADEAAAGPAFAAGLWDVVARLGIVENATPMVPGTKCLHHVLPLLVVPIDRRYTGSFFQWSTSAVQSRQPLLFEEAVAAFSTIARAVDLGRHTGSGWRLAEAKLVDNAIIGYCRAERLVGPSAR